MTPHRPTLQLAVNALLHRALAVQQALQVPVQLGSTEIVPLCAIGIGRWPLDGDQPPALLEAAQAARHDTAPGGTPAFFRPETKARALRAMQIEAALGQALQTGEFELHYQPKVDLGSGAVIGAEALLRWQSAMLGNVLPAEIIPIADRAWLRA